jgi:spermidine synthase
VTQIVIVREAMVVFEGNELVIGLALGTWMLLTALGARLSASFKSVPILHLLLAFTSLLSVILLSFLRSILVSPGAMAGFYTTAFILAISVLPFSFFSGMLFPVLSEGYKVKKGMPDASGAYALESAGSLAGGLIFSLLIVYFFNNWQSLLVVFLLNILLSMFIWWTKGKKLLASFLGGVFLAIIAWSFIARPENLLEKMRHPGQEILEQQDTPFGRLLVTRLNGQVTIFDNGKPLSQVDDVVTREENVHYAMLVKSEAERVLMISGGTSGSLDELLKYRNVKIDYVETDPFLMDMVEKYFGLTQDVRINMIYKDPLRFLRQNGTKYDVILVNVPDPQSGLSNRFFTVGFFKEAKNHLVTNGMLSVSISGGSNYLSKEDIRLHSVIFNSLKLEFKQVGLVPGQRHYFLASDQLPMKMLGEAYQDSGIENSYVNPSYINEMQLGQRSHDIMQKLDPGAGLNMEVKPVGYWLQVQRWLAQFNINKYLLPGILLLSLLVFLLLLKPLDLGLFSGGLSASSSEMILLLWLQSVFGYIYQVAGLVFASFMAGLVAGAWYLPRFLKKTDKSAFLKLQALMIVYLLVMLLYIYFSSGFAGSGWLHLPLILILTLAAGAVTGLQYTVAMRIRKDSPLNGISRSYAADLAGSALGALLVSVFCLPLLGIYLTGFALAGINLAAIGLIYARKLK